MTRLKPLGNGLLLFDEDHGNNGSNRVLFVTNMWPDHDRPYYGTFVKSQAMAIREQGVPVDALIIRGYASTRAYLQAVAALRRHRMRSGYVVTHAHFGHSALAAFLARSSNLVISYCGEDLLGAPRPGGGKTVKSRIEVSVFRQLARAAGATITKSAEMERVLPATCRAANRVIPNGVDLDRFRPRNRVRARQSLEWPLDRKLVLFLGDPKDPRKNFSLAKRAFELLATTRDDVEIITPFGAPSERVPVMMNAADCLLVTSLSEGSPNVVKEAMASALPIVATRVGDVAERTKGVPGCFVTDYDAHELADALSRAVDFGRSLDARKAATELSNDRVAQQVISVYREVCS